MNPKQTQTTSTSRELMSIVNGEATADGAGVRLTRYLGSKQLNYLDPFLLFDVFESDQVADYIAGFPHHPHRGFETVTYLLNGKMRHRDNAGHDGVIEPGGVQWMTAGRGIVHSEHPEQQQGLLHGFQLWVNLPAAHKMTDPNYQEFSAAQIPVKRTDDFTARIIAGNLHAMAGAVQNQYVQANFADITINAGHYFNTAVSHHQSAFIYVIKGDIEIGELARTLSTKQLGVLSPGEQITLKADQTARLLLLTADPLHEPIVRGGPFVMNSKAEVLAAFEDFEHNRL